MHSEGIIEAEMYASLAQLAEQNETEWVITLGKIYQTE